MTINPDLLYDGDEVHELLDLVQTDGSIHDLDRYQPEHMQSTLGTVLCQLMHRLEKAEKAIEQSEELSAQAKWDSRYRS